MQQVFQETQAIVANNTGSTEFFAGYKRSINS